MADGPGDAARLPIDGTGSSATVWAGSVAGATGSSVAPVISGYRITGPIAGGGMGMVYAAIHEALQRQVALKIMRVDLARDQEYVERFLREARAAAKITHPGVVSIHDAGSSGEHLYLAMEFIPGGDLRHRIAGGQPVPEAEALRLIEAAAEAVGAIHAAGLVHRDIKPENILVAADGQPKITDLGLAREVAGDDRMTQTGHALGTPSYMAPEQAHGIADLDARCDVYGLGATLYALLTAQPPFTGATAYAIVHRVIADPPPDPRWKMEHVSAAAAAIVVKAMAKARADRYQSTAEFVEDVRAARAGLALPHARAPGHRRDRARAIASRAGAMLATAVIAILSGLRAIFRRWLGLPPRWRWSVAIAVVVASAMVWSLAAGHARARRLAEARAATADDGNPFQQIGTSIRGTLKDIVDGSVDAVDRRAIAAVSRQGMTLRRHHHDRASSVIEARFADGDACRIELDQVTSDTTRISIQIGAFGDKTRERAVLDAIGR